MAEQVPDILRGWKEIADALGANESTIRRWMTETQDDEMRAPIFKLCDSPNGPVVAERGELLRWLLRRARRFPLTEG